MGANKVPPHHLVYSQPWTLSYGWKFVGISNDLIADTADTVYPQMPHFQLAIFVYIQVAVVCLQKFAASDLTTEKMIHQVKFSRHTRPI